MTRKSLPTTPTPLQTRRSRVDEHGDDDDDDDEEEKQLHQIQTNSREKDLQIGSLSPFRLPNDWFVEEKPRPSNPSHVDKYYYEPGTGRKFRSLVSVQRYLTEKTRDLHTTERLISENENTMQVVTQIRESTSFFKLPNDWIVKEKPSNNINYAGVIHRTYIERGTGQRFQSLRAVERYLNGENACTATPKVPRPRKEITPLVKSSTGKQSAPSVKSCLKAVKKCSLVAEEDGITLKSLKHAIKSTHSKKSGSRKKINSGKDNKASMLNLSIPPAKVSWVLSGPGGFWSPFLDDSIVPESVKLKWSEAFVLSIHDGDTNALNC